MIEIPRARATIEVVMNPTSMHGDVVTLEAMSGPLRIVAEANYDDIAKYAIGGDWRSMKVPVRLV